MASSLAPTTFLNAVAREVKLHYSESGHEPHSRVRSRLAQFWWGATAEIHFEIAVHERTLQIEIGLHFEASPQRNRELYAKFGRQILWIQDELGDTIWLEEWDRGWARIYETQPLSPMDDARVYAVAGRICGIMDCLQPMLDKFSGND